MISKNAQFKLQKIRESGKFCCLKIESDYDYVWDISLTLESRDEFNSGHVPNYRSGCYEDLDKAVDEIYKQVKDLL